jgi:radical SAM superfamily enzyme YgiQ (UPF0313 family)
MALRLASAKAGARAGLADYEEVSRSPLRRADLLDSAARPEGSVFFPLFRERLGDALRDDGEGLLGISLGFLGQALSAFALAGLARKLNPDLRIVLGGGLLSSWIAQGKVSAVETFGGLFDALLPGRAEESLDHWLARGSAAATSPGRRDPAPDFSGFRGYRYFAPVRILPYNFSTGCSWRRCTFCPETAEGAPYRGTRRSLALRELAVLAKAETPGLLHLTDNEVAPLYLRALAEAGPGLPWYGFARFTPLLEDPSFCRDLAASGCRLLQLGLESADQGVLDKLDKGIELAAVGRSLDSLAAAGVGVYLYLLFGTPAEDRRAALRTRDFVAERAAAIGFINAAIFNLPATSAEAAGMETRDFYEGDLALYREFAHPAGWNRAQVRRFLAEDFAGHASIAPVLRRTPPVFTSSHAPFFVEPGPRTHGSTGR